MRKRKNFFLIWLLAGFLILANLIASNRMATDGEEIKKLEKEISFLQKEKTSLEQAIADRSSLLKLKGRAEALGFVFSPTVVYLRAEAPVAMR